MVIATGKVHHGTIELQATELLEGAVVTVLAPDGDETFVLGAEDERALVAALQEADSGSVISASILLDDIRHS
jgi:hypothetical protein